MTIALAVKVHDGIVLATDSAVTMSATDTNGMSTFQNTYNNGNKLFNLVKGQSIGGMVWGAGSIGNASISTLIKDLRKRMTSTMPAHLDWHLDPAAYQIEAVAKKVATFFEEQVVANPTSKPTGGFLVAGYSTEGTSAESWLINLVDGHVHPPVQPFGGPQEAYCLAYGQPDAAARIMNGVASGLEAGLKAKGVPDAELASFRQSIIEHSSAGLISPAMPIQDAVELAEFLAYATAQFIRFIPGPPTVGGPIDVAAITKHEGFKWVKRKYYFRDKYNPRNW